MRIEYFDGLLLASLTITYKGQTKAGCRVAEIQRVDRSDIDWQRSAATVLGKGNKAREVYFGAKARIWLQRYLNERSDSDRALFVTVRQPHRLSVHEIQYIFKRMAKRCGLEERVSPHKMRHTLATVLINQGGSVSRRAVHSWTRKARDHTIVRYAQWLISATGIRALLCSIGMSKGLESSTDSKPKIVKPTNKFSQIYIMWYFWAAMLNRAKFRRGGKLWLGTFMK